MSYHCNRNCLDPEIWTLHFLPRRTTCALKSHIYLAPHRGRARYCNAHVCLFVCLCVCVFVCLCVCVCVCPCFRKISKCNISAISQPIIMKLGIHITYGYTVTDKYSKIKVVERLKTLFGHISGTNGRRDSGLVSKCRGMSQPTWTMAPSLIALFFVVLRDTTSPMSTTPGGTGQLLVVKSSVSVFTNQQ